MPYFLKLNGVSILYALMALIPIQLTANIYRIYRLTGWKPTVVNGTLLAVTLTLFIVGTIGIFLLSEKWLKGRNAGFWTAVLWIPFFLIFTYWFAGLFPITNPGDQPNPASGVIILSGLFAYPFYILILTYVNAPEKSKNPTI
ncbi:hypothetical protein ERJ70_02925 [Sediminibacillus dalangtanensis]|uniref:Cytochrome b/b6 C-terminal region profile domain-containing protein n=1 Tax=Sediminibacillus dalangtanensis TaxID=2729421 RepID=A0ABX7VND0_9BACI|nr:hypothetical protein [Sediminibacillus dalangtanensis]QTM98359.1 hypothetical protein ERJ70_02925 [Sediminibacillus dalangtanensis]